MNEIDALYLIRKKIAEIPKFPDFAVATALLLKDMAGFEGVQINFFGHSPITAGKVPEGYESEKKAFVVERKEGTVFCVPIKFEGRVIGNSIVLTQRYESIDRTMKFLEIVAGFLAMAYVMSPKAQKDYFVEGKIVFSSEKMRQVIEIAKAVAKTDATVLITGETGVGKELVAELIHENSARAGKPFVKVNCAAIPESLIESELFGYEKGAFTGAMQSKPGKFELADKGTIFLDEIGDMPLPAQAKLLRVLQTREVERIGGTHPVKVDVRIICATNQNLEKLVEEGRFRQDLYFRINVVKIEIPPLRERKEDIIPLIEHFLKKFNAKYSKSIWITREAVDMLTQYNWPGNVRELENTIERLVIISSDTAITVEDVEEVLGGYRKPHEETEVKEQKQQYPSDLPLPELVKKIETEKILETLAKTKNLSEAAKVLGLTRRQLEWRIAKYKIRVPRKM